MPRSPQPWHRASADAWFVTIAGRKVRLTDRGGTKEEAHRTWHALMAVEAKGPRAEPIGVLVLVNQFLGHCDRELSPATLAWYSRHLGSFCEMHGEMPAAAVLPVHVTRWVAAHEWGPSTRRGAITAVKRCFAWAARQRYLDADPLIGIERPAAQKRKKILSQGQFEVILEAIPDREFRDLLVVLRETGARPGELTTAEARHVHPTEPYLVLDRHKTARKTGEPRVIPLNRVAAEIVRRLAEEHKTGPIFRNTKGTAWTRHTIAHRFERLRIKLGLGPEATAYAIRHRFATDLTRDGVPDVTAAAILGHKGTQMIQTYSHVEKDHGHLLDTVERVRGRQVDRDVRPDPGASRT
jgi:site-specific recombinase XerD